MPGIEVLDVTAKPEAVGGGVTEYAVQSYFTKWNYMYDNRYLLEAGFPSRRRPTSDSAGATSTASAADGSSTARAGSTLPG